MFRHGVFQVLVVGIAIQFAHKQNGSLSSSMAILLGLKDFSNKSHPCEFALMTFVDHDAGDTIV